MRPTSDLARRLRWALLRALQVGFGASPKGARANASLQALRKLEFIDHDEGRVLTTPVYGRESAARRAPRVSALLPEPVALLPNPSSLVHKASTLTP